MSFFSRSSRKVVVLCGGVGGSKFVEGLAGILNPGQMTVIGNTGDDFIHLGLRICPDLDTIMYRLAGQVNLDTGWGRRKETWRVMAEVDRLGGPTWFGLGDADLAVHLLRTHWLHAGLSLTEITGRLGRRLGINCQLLPMSDHFVPTRIETTAGMLGFQEWFVRERWGPPVKRVVLPEDESTTDSVVEALTTAAGIIIVPSNPFLSIDPILNLAPVGSILQNSRERVIAISPLVGENAVKGPLAKMMRERGLPVEAGRILDHYRPYISAFVQDRRDRTRIVDDSIPVLVTDTLMKSKKDEERLAAEVLAFWGPLLLD